MKINEYDTDIYTYKHASTIKSRCDIMWSGCKYETRRPTQPYVLCVNGNCQSVKTNMEREEARQTQCR